MHLLGSTGSGKSTLLCNLILDDIHAGRGAVVIDPKGDLVLDVLDRLPASARRPGRAHRPRPDRRRAPSTRSPASMDRHPPTTTWSSTTSCRSSPAIFQRHWGPRIDDVLRVACLTLMRARQRHPHVGPAAAAATNSSGPSSPSTSTTRKGCAGSGSGTKARRRALRAQVIGPVLARLRAFLLRDFVRRTVGTPRSTFDMRRVLDGGILLARLPKGQTRGGDREAPRLLRVRERVAGRHRPRPHPRSTAAGTLDLHRRGAQLPQPRRLRRRHARRGPRLPPLAWSWPTRTSPSSPATPNSRSRRTPATRSSSPARPRTPTSSPGTPCPNSTNTTWPTSTPTPPPPGSSSTAGRPRRSPCAPTHPAEPVGEATAIRRAVADPHAGGRSAISELARRTARAPRQTTSAAAPDSEPTGGPTSSAPRPRQQRP